MLLAIPQPAETTPDMYWQRTFPGRTDEARSARTFLAALLSEYPCLDEMLLAVDVVNALQHSLSGVEGSTFRLEVLRDDDGLTISVTDQGGRTSPLSGRPAAWDEPGRGLAALAALAARWACSGDDRGRTISALILTAWHGLSVREAAGVVDVEYATRTWSDQKHASVLATGGMTPSADTLRLEISAGQYQLTRGVSLNGRAAIMLVWRQDDKRPEGFRDSSRTVLWVDAGTYFPIRESVERIHHSSRTRYVTDYEAIGATKSALALLTPPIPPGFTQTATPHQPFAG